MAIIRKCAGIVSGRVDNDHTNNMYSHFGFWYPYEDSATEKKNNSYYNSGALPDASINGQKCKR